MTNHKLRWIVYMQHIIKPTPGTERACRDMLSERYDNAYWQGYQDSDREHDDREGDKT